MSAGSVVATIQLPETDCAPSLYPDRLNALPVAKIGVFDFPRGLYQLRKIVGILENAGGLAVLESQALLYSTSRLPHLKQKKILAEAQIKELLDPCS